MHEIRKPIFIMHELPTGKAECIVAGPPGADAKIFGIYIADLIGHTAKALGVPASDVTDWINRELNDPTTTLTRTNVQ